MRFEHLNLLRDSDNSVSTLGLMDTRANIMYLRCTYADYQRDYAILANEMLCRGNMRVYFHELTHFVQLNTTPAGFYLSLLEDYQASQLRNILKYIPDAKLPVINDLIRRYDVDKYPEAWFYLRKWYIAELMLCAFSGNFRRFRMFASPTVFMDEIVSDIFTELDFDIARHMKFRWNFKWAGSASPPYISAEKLLELQDDSSVLENHCRMAEFWWDKMDVTAFAARIQGDLDEYVRWIKRYLQTRNPKRMDSMVAEFIAMSELALFAPVLPWTPSRAEQNFWDMMPTSRMAKLINCIERVRPVENINDYNRFINELGQCAGFSSVNDVCADILDFTVPERATSYWVDLFYKAIERRKENFSLFHNYGLWHPLAEKVEPFSALFTKEFSPPLVCFLDMVREKKTGNGANAGDQMLIRFLYRTFCKAAMTGLCKYDKQSIELPCPVPANREQKRMLEYLTNLYISKELLTQYRVTLA